MEYLTLIALHVFFGILWAGGAISAGLFIIPSVLEAGPAGGAVMAGAVRRRLPTFLATAATIVVLSGLRLYSMRFSTDWLVTPHGVTLTLGAVFGLGAFVLGFFIQRPVSVKLGSLAAQIAASGAPPTPAQAAELNALRTRLGRIARITAWHLIGAALLMSIHGLMAAASG